MSADIIWAAVVVYSISVGVWLAYHLVTNKRVSALADANDARLTHQGEKLGRLQQDLLATQKEIVITNEAVTRIENRLASAASSKGAQKWPGGT